MFTYCNNNPVVLTDISGSFAISSFVGGIIGGALGGALISTVSYAVSTALSGQQMTGEGLLNAAATGALSGAVGAAIGSAKAIGIFGVKAVKAMASSGLGLGMYLKTYQETEVPADKKEWAAISVGVITFGSTFLGSLIQTGECGFLLSIFTNFSATTLVGTPAEVTSVAIQHNLSSNNTQNTSGTIPIPFVPKPIRQNRFTVNMIN